MTNSGTEKPRRRKRKAAKPAAEPATQPTFPGRGRIGTRNLLPPTFVLVASPEGVPPGTPVEVDGEPGALITNQAGELEAGQHLFFLRHSGKGFQRVQRCPSGRPRNDPVTVVLAPVTAAEIAAVRSVPPPLPEGPPDVQARGGSDRLTVAAGASPGAQTIIYIHGIGNKPAPSVLKCQWDTALFGRPLGDRSRMAYWVDRARYPEPVPADCASADTVPAGGAGARTWGIGVPANLDQAAFDDPQVEAELFDEVEALAENPAQAQELLRIAWAMRRKAAAKTEGPSTRVFPDFLRPTLSWTLTRAFLADVHDFLFVPERRQRMLDSFAERLNAGGGPFVVIAHSQGSLIAYELLRRLSKAQCDVAASRNDRIATRP